MSNAKDVKDSLVDVHIWPDTTETDAKQTVSDDDASVMCLSDHKIVKYMSECIDTLKEIDVNKLRVSDLLRVVALMAMFDELSEVTKALTDKDLKECLDDFESIINKLPESVCVMLPDNPTVKPPIDL